MFEEGKNDKKTLNKYMSVEQEMSRLMEDFPHFSNEGIYLINGYKVGILQNMLRKDNPNFVKVHESSSQTEEGSGQPLIVSAAYDSLKELLEDLLSQPATFLWKEKN